MRKMTLFATALGLATAAFWGTMLMAPPTSKAALSSPSPDSRCMTASAEVTARLSAEQQRSHASQQGGSSLALQRIQGGLETARVDCQAGRTARSMSNLHAAAGMLSRLEGQRPRQR
jgi:hypothetical protein